MQLLCNLCIYVFIVNWASSPKQPSILYTYNGPLYTRTFFVSSQVQLQTPFSSSSETQGQIVGPKMKIKTGGKKFDKQKYERKIQEKFSAQSGASICLAVWNWYVKSLSPGARIFLSYFCSSNFFPSVLIFVFGPTICPWVSEDAFSYPRVSIYESFHCNY